MHRLTVCFVLILFCLTVLPVSARQDSAFTVQTITIKNAPVYNMRVSPDGQTAAIYAGEGSRILLNVAITGYTVDPRMLPIRLIDLTTGDELGQLAGSTDYVSDVVFTPDGQRLVSYHANGDIYLWDTASLTSIQHITGLMGQAKLEFMPDGKTLVIYKALDRVGQFLLWDMETGFMTQVWRTPFQSFGDLKLDDVMETLGYSYPAFDLSPDGTFLATANSNGEVLLWDTTTLQQTVVRPGETEDQRGRFNVPSVLFSADSKTLVYYERTAEQTHFWDIASGTETNVLSIGSPSFALSPGNTILAWATRDDLWYAPVDQPDAATKIMDFPDGFVGTERLGMPGVVFSADGSRMVVGGMGDMSGGTDNQIYVITIN